MTTQRQTAKMARRLARIIEEHDGDAFEVSRSIEEAPKRYALVEANAGGSEPPYWSFITMPIEVSRGSLDDARFALAFFQLNQTERVTAEVDDDHLRVYLDDGWQLAWYLDTDQPEVHVGRRPKWYTLDEWLRTTHNLTDDEEAETVASEITDAMANLAGFLYSAQIGAINALSAKSRP